MFYTCSNGVRVPATVVGFAPDGLVHLEYFRDVVKVMEHTRGACIHMSLSLVERL